MKVNHGVLSPTSAVITSPHGSRTDSRAGIERNLNPYGDNQLASRPTRAAELIRNGILRS